MNELTVIGLDYATDPRRVGMALGRWRRDTRLRVIAVETGREQSPASIVSRWLRDHSEPALIAIDAPLGWPSALGEALRPHRAGDELKGDANDLFRRATDQEIQNTVGIRPLDVGSNLIARTAHAALKILHEIREITARPIPLAWRHDGIAETTAIEVYPAATLHAHGVTHKGYKKQSQGNIRQEVFCALLSHLSLCQEPNCQEQKSIKESACGNADILDGLVCLLAAKDFLDGKAMAPRDLDRAKQEGWIWSLPRQNP
jgi:hypothetical protein